MVDFLQKNWIALAATAATLGAVLLAVTWVQTFSGPDGLEPVDTIVTRSDAQDSATSQIEMQSLSLESENGPNGADASPPPSPGANDQQQTREPSEQLNIEDLAGLWDGFGYFCEYPRLEERIRITVENGTLTATKVSGDDCVPAGEITFQVSLEGVDLPDPNATAADLGLAPALVGTIRVSEGPNTPLRGIPIRIANVTQDELSGFEPPILSRLTRAIIPFKPVHIVSEESLHFSGTNLATTTHIRSDEALSFTGTGSGSMRPEGEVDVDIADPGQK